MRALTEVEALVSAPARQSRALRDTGHRPWPLPRGPWVLAQSWENLLFAHWPVGPETMRELVTNQLPLDTFDGEAWLGITPFVLTGLRVRYTLPLPRISRFLELNVRTYVTLDGKPGIFFFSLDASSPLAVRAARLLYKLPYFEARMSCAQRDGGFRYDSERARPATSRPAGFGGWYGPSGDVSRASPGTLEHFLTERYCLYALDERGRVHRAEIHHSPWPLQPAAAEIERNTMAPGDLKLGEEPLLHFSARQDTLVWPLTRAR